MLNSHELRRASRTTRGNQVDTKLGLFKRTENVHIGRVSNPRRILTVRVSEEAGDAIAKHCNNQGITITAWFEAVGMRLADLYATGKKDPNLKSVTDETAQVARQVDAERRARSNRAR